MTKEAESKALQYLHNSTAHKGLTFEHRVLYEGDLQFADSNTPVKIIALELGQNAFLIFSLTRSPVDEASYGNGEYEFIALYDDRNQAIQAVFNITTKSC
jgi:hypothetical protein